MSLDKGINHGKEHRKPYYKSKAFDPSCRPGGDCPYCKSGRQHKYKKKKLVADEKIKDFRNGENNE
jgi:hypothetical protein